MTDLPPIEMPEDSRKRFLEGDSLAVKRGKAKAEAFNQEQEARYAATVAANPFWKRREG